MTHGTGTGEANKSGSTSLYYRHVSNSTSQKNDMMMAFIKIIAELGVYEFLSPVEIFPLQID